jgi:predicted ATPase
VRDAAYAGLIQSRRVHLHAATANALEQKFPDVLQTQPEIVAYHYTQANSYEKALYYWYEAAKRSSARSAHNEAVGHLKQGLAQIPNIIDPMQRNKMELLLQTSLGNSLRTIKGWSTDSVKQAYTRALKLSKGSGLDEHIFPAVFGLWFWNFVRASLGEAQELAAQLINTAENVENSAYKVLAHEALGFTAFAQGKFAAAHAELEVALPGVRTARPRRILICQPKIREFTRGYTTALYCGSSAIQIRHCGFAPKPAFMQMHPNIRSAKQWHDR